MPRLSKADAAKKLQELRALDPCRRFIEELATTTQQEILKDSTLNRLVTTANQGGKTTTAVAECAAMLRGIHPHKPWFGPISVLVIVPSRTQAAGIWGKRLLKASDVQHKVGVVELSQRPFIPESEIAHISWNYSPQGKYPGKCTLKNGSEFIIMLSGDPHAWERIQGFPFDEVFQDEAIGNEDLGKEIMLRLSKARTTRIRESRSWGGGRTWVATATLVNDEFEEYKRRCEENASDHKLFWIHPSENPAVSMEVRNAMRGSMSAEDAAIRLDGTEGAIHDVLIFRQQWKKERHVVPASPVGPKDNIWCAWDPGWDHPYGLVFCAVNQFNPTQLRVVQCYRDRKKTLDHIANQIAMYLNGRWLEGLVFDPAALKTEHSRGESLSYQMETLLNQMGVKSMRGILMGRNRYEDTLPLMQRYLDPVPTDKEADPQLIIDSPTESNGTGMLVEQLSKYRRKLVQKGSSLRGHNIHRQDDDLVDPVRYLISRQPAWADRQPNLQSSAPVSSGVARARAPEKPDPFKITDDMDADQRLHVMRLRESASRTMFSQNGMRSLPVGVLGW
jgi:hypothetical protein